jgi:parallel beta-helix repeat protein
MRFNHQNNCGDCGILNEGSLSQLSILQQSHQKKNGWPWCGHNNQIEHSWHDFDPHHCFFFEMGDESDHSGSSDPLDWVVYGHVYPTDSGGVNVQYWFFYPYNDGVAIQNHEGDWENIIVELDGPIGGEYTVTGLVYYRHGEPETFEPYEIDWFSDSHPVVYTGRGSHASYESTGRCMWYIIGFREWGCASCEDLNSCANAWFTWSNGRPVGHPGRQGWGIRNMAEKHLGEIYFDSHTLFTHYSGLWGEIGEFEFTTGPKGPAYQDSWYYNLDLGSVNSPPYTPSNEFPANGAVDAEFKRELTWRGGDPDMADRVTYTVRFGTSPYPPVVSEGQTALSFDPGQLDESTTYFWKIQAKDPLSLVANGPTWSFTTTPFGLDTAWVDDDFDETTPGWGVDHFATIQGGIDAVSDRYHVWGTGVVHVAEGAYSENVVINKAIDVVADEPGPAYIFSTGEGDTVRITEGYSTISGFTIYGAGPEWGDSAIEAAGDYITIADNRLYSAPHGLLLGRARYASVFDNEISWCTNRGISLWQTFHSQIAGNLVTQSGMDGIRLYVSEHNEFSENQIIRNGYGVYTEQRSFYNLVYNNNFIGNSVNAYVLHEEDNYFDDGLPLGGNYWDDYMGDDDNSDGFGDIPYDIDVVNSDHLPLMNPGSWIVAVDSANSSLVLTSPGLTSCPSGDFPPYEHLLVRLIDTSGRPVASLPAAMVQVAAEATDAETAGSVTFAATATTSTTDAFGEIRFEITADSSIIGTAEITVTAAGIELNQRAMLPCNSVDLNTDGVLNLPDISLFSQLRDDDYHWMIDFNWDGEVNLSDVGFLSQHLGH